MRENTIRQKIIIPFSLSILLLVITVHAGLHVIAAKDIAHDTEALLLDTSELLKRQLEQDAQLLHSLLTFIKVDTKLQKAWWVKDRQALFELGKYSLWPNLVQTQHIAFLFSQF